jgi:hypothetical protein
MANPPWRPQHKFKVSPPEERTIDGILFGSKLESDYYRYLKMRVSSGAVIFFLRQVAFHLPGNTRYVVDFQEFHADGSVHFVDVKGIETDKFKMKQRQVEDLYPVEIEIVKARELKRLIQPM